MSGLKDLLPVGTLVRELKGGSILAYAKAPIDEKATLLGNRGRPLSHQTHSEWFTRGYNKSALHCKASIFTNFL
jgi:hypothetical protein